MDKDVRSDQAYLAIQMIKCEQCSAQQSRTFTCYFVKFETTYDYGKHVSTKLK